MDKAREILEYLEALADELVLRDVNVPYHILISGGAFMLLQGHRRSTNDIDFAAIVPCGIKADQVFRTTVLHRNEIATRGSRGAFSESVWAVAGLYNLPEDWLNDEAAVYLYDDAPRVDVYLWRAFAGVLFVYLPTAEYVFALKLTAYRRKDRGDCKMLARSLGIRTPEQARVLLDRYILPEAQAFWQVEKKLKRFFR